MHSWSRLFGGCKGKSLLYLTSLVVAMGLVVPTVVFAGTDPAASGSDGDKGSPTPGGWTKVIPWASSFSGARVSEPDTVLVQFVSGTKRKEMAAVATATGAMLEKARPAQSSKSLPIALYSSPSLSTEELAALLEAQPSVVAAASNISLKLAEVGGSATPNDPYFGDQWALENTGQVSGETDADIDAQTAWQVNTGSGDVVVVVIDSGVDYTHPDLEGNIWVNPGETADGADNDGNGYIDDVYGIDAFNGDSDPYDDDGHGTHVAGIIGAMGNNEVGVTGVAQRVKIMALKAFDSDGWGDGDQVVECINYAITMKESGANVVAINASFVGSAAPSGDDPLYSAIQAAGEAGIIFVAAAGNDNSSSPHWPAAYDLDNIIAVGASTSFDNRAGYSNYGESWVDLFAPGGVEGQAILSTYAPMAYALGYGTSMAAPHVTGTVALLAAAAPSDDTSTCIERILSTVDTPAALDGLCATDGRLNTGAALQAPTRIEQDDENLRYTGTDDWTTADRDDASGGSYVTTREPGSAVNVEFTGRYLAWYARTTPWFGKAVVVVDADTEDEVTTTVDLWSWKSKYQRKVFDTGLLDEGDHTVSIYYRGKKNWLSSNTTICVDAFEVIGSLKPAGPAPLRLFTDTYQQRSSKITYLGRWRTVYKSKASGGSLASTSKVGAAAVIEFTGTDITALVRTAPRYGIAKVTLDGVVQDPVDFYSPTVKYKQPLIQKTGLAYGPHTLTIECTGEMNESASGRGISLDAVVVTGYLTQAQTLTRFQQDDEEMCSYSSPEDWNTSSSYKFSGGTLVSTKTDDAGVTITFTGTYATIVSKVSPSYGIADIVIDEGEPDEVLATADYYRSERKFKKTVFRTGILTPGEHTLAIYYSGEKNSRSTGTTIGLDAIDVLVVEP